MIQFIADENFNGNIIRGVFLQLPTIDLVRAIDVGLTGLDDPELLEWAANHGRLLLTHDARTLAGFAYERVKGGLPMPGVFEVKPNRPIGPVITDIVVIAQCSEPRDWEGQVIYLPI